MKVRLRVRVRAGVRVRARVRVRVSGQWSVVRVRVRHRLLEPHAHRRSGDGGGRAPVGEEGVRPQLERRCDGAAEAERVEAVERWVE